MEPVSDPRRATDFKQKGSIAFLLCLYFPREQDPCFIWKLEFLMCYISQQKFVSQKSYSEPGKIKGESGWAVKQNDEGLFSSNL